jgi:PLD-like domain
MKLLTQDDNLDAYLRSQKNKSVRIVTAFVGGTEGLIQQMIRAKCNVELIVGTINYFSSPKFLKAMAKKDSGVKLYVDFRGGNSVHWKLALIGPATVVIGSANLTKRGVGLHRDTCVVIEDEPLHRSYVKMIGALKMHPQVVSSRHHSFDGLLADYRTKHDQMQRGLALGQASAAKTQSLEDWLANDANQQITSYIWSEDHTDEARKTARTIVKDASRVAKKTGASIKVDSKIREFFTYDEQPRKPPFERGDIVLCCNERGSYMDFYTFDIVERGTIMGHDGCKYDGYYMISLRQPRYKRLFDFKPHVPALQQLIVKIVKGKSAGKVVIKRTELAELLR